MITTSFGGERTKQEQHAAISQATEILGASNKQKEVLQLESSMNEFPDAQRWLYLELGLRLKAPDCHLPRQDLVDHLMKQAYFRDKLWSNWKSSRDWADQRSSRAREVSSKISLPSNGLGKESLEAWPANYAIHRTTMPQVDCQQPIQGFSMISRREAVGVWQRQEQQR